MSTDNTTESLADTLKRMKEEPEEGAARFEKSVDLDALGVDPSDNSEEKLLTSKSDKDMGVEIPELPDPLPVPEHNPAIQQDVTDGLRDEIENRFHGVTPLGKVSVDAEERGRFLRAALTDSPMWFDVLVEGVGVTVRVVIPSERFITDTPTALKSWAKAGLVDEHSDMQWYLAFQQIHVWFQVRAINGIATPWSIFFDDDYKHGDMRRFMADPDNFEEIIHMNDVRWKILILAMRIAEKKYHICTEALRDRTFFTGAGTD